MAEKKIQENPLPEEQQTEADKDTMQPKTVPDKDTTTVPLPAPIPVPVPPAPRSMPSFTKTPPNDLYRRLLPAVLFLVTFVTVMTMLLIYMDTVALGAQQFRLNMSRDYELARIPQESSALVAYVRQLHLAPRQAHTKAITPEPTRTIRVMDNLYGEIYNGTFVEFLPRGPRDGGTQYLEWARAWAGVVVRAAPRDYLALRGSARALHACLSPSDHPREVTYHEGSPEGHESTFTSRVLCLPLATVLLAAEATRARYVLLAGDAAPAALHHLPYTRVRLQMIEYRSTDMMARNQTTDFLNTKNYTVAASFPDSIIYALKTDQV